MRLVAFLVTFVAFVAFAMILPDTPTGNIARYPVPYPGISPITLSGEMTDANNMKLPPGRLIAYTPDGKPFGEGGVTLIKYTLTLAQGWHEQPPIYAITYYNYQDLTEYYCTAIDIRNMFKPIYEYTIQVNIECKFNLTKPEPDWPIITGPMEQGDILII